MPDIESRNFIVPTVLGAVEAGTSAAELTEMILLFTGAYLSSCSQFGRIEVRLAIGAVIQNKALTMSYPHVEDQKVRRKMDKTSMLAASNTSAVEAV